MSTIGWVGLGNMGRPMTANLDKAGHTVNGYDLVPESRGRSRGARCQPREFDRRGGRRCRHRFHDAAQG